MERELFMAQLERLLADIPETERQEALDYYEGYFDDAGPDQEGAVIRELGSPGKVAAVIKANLKESNDLYSEYTERGYEDIRMREQGEMPDKYTAVMSSRHPGEEASGEWEDGREEDPEGKFQDGQAGYEDRRQRREERRGAREERRRDRQEQRWDRQEQRWNRREQRWDRREEGARSGRKRGNAFLLLLIIFVIFASPLIPLVKGTVGGILAVIFVILFLPVLLFLLFGALAVGMVFGGLGRIVAGIGACIGNPAAGVFRIGFGCILMAAGLLLALLILWLAVKLLPRWLRRFTDFCQRMFHRGERGDET